jgi:hypothetical protein
MSHHDTTQLQARVKASDDTLEQYRQQLHGYEELLSHLGDELSTCKQRLVNSELAAAGADGKIPKQQRQQCYQKH